jgi:hypothetical protein
LPPESKDLLFAPTTKIWVPHPFAVFAKGWEATPFVHCAVLMQDLVLKPSHKLVKSYFETLGQYGFTAGVDDTSQSLSIGREDSSRSPPASRLSVTTNLLE